MMVPARNQRSLLVNIYLGRIRRVYTGWRAVPGKNLMIFDDTLVEVRASALDGLITGGPVGTLANTIAQGIGDKVNAPLDDQPWTPGKLIGLHPANWMLPASSVRSATLAAPGIGIRRRLTLQTEEGTRIVEWEARPNPDPKTIRMLRQVFGDRLSLSGRFMRFEARLEKRGKSLTTSDPKSRKSFFRK